MNLPNKLTISRIFLVFVFIICYYAFPKVPIAGIIFIIASVTDFIDGYIARKYNLITEFGKFMDPLADKILVLSALVIFVEQSIIPAWGVIIILFREFAISGLRLIAARNSSTISANKSGKIKTVFQLVGISMVLLTVNYVDCFIFKAGIIFIFISIVLTLTSFLVYIKENIKVLKIK